MHLLACAWVTGVGQGSGLTMRPALKRLAALVQWVTYIASVKEHSGAFHRLASYTISFPFRHVDSEATCCRWWCTVIGLRGRSESEPALGWPRA